MNTTIDRDHLHRAAAALRAATDQAHKAGVEISRATQNRNDDGILYALNQARSAEEASSMALALLTERGALAEAVRLPPVNHTMTRLVTALVDVEAEDREEARTLAQEWVSEIVGYLAPVDQKVEIVASSASCMSFPLRRSLYPLIADPVQDAPPLGQIVAITLLIESFNFNSNNSNKVPVRLEDAAAWTRFGGPALRLLSLLLQ